MVFLGDLPDELIFHICSTLMLESLSARTNPRRVRLAALQARLALSRFSQTSQRYRSVAQPLLFRAFGDMIFRPHTRWRFLEAILDRPELAREVRYMNPSLMYVDRRPRTRDDNAKMFERAASILSPETAEALFTRLKYKASDYEGYERRVAEDILSPIFAAFLPNLRALKLILSSFVGTPLLLQIPTVLDLLPGCKKIESIDIGKLDSISEESSLNPQTLLLLTLPSLRKVTLSEFSCNGDIQLEPGSLAVADLTLERVEINRSNLKTLLQACRMLKKFRFDWSTYNYYLDYASLPRLQDILVALNPHKAHLQSLSLDLKGLLSLAEYSFSEIPQHWAWGTRCSFSDFSALEHLNLDQKTILANELGVSSIGDTTDTPWSLVQLLPASMKSLEVSMLYPMQEALTQLAIQSRKDFPALSIVVASSSYSTHRLESLNNLTALFAEAGIILDFSGREHYAEDEGDSWESDPLFKLLTIGDLLE